LVPRGERDIEGAVKVTRVGAWLLGFCCWSVAATAEQKTTEPLVALRAEVTGPANCHTKDFFLQEILSRTPRAGLAQGGELGWTLRVVVTEEGSRYRAKLSILATEGAWLERELIAPTCDDALEALSVVVSVLVETAVEQSQQHEPLPSATEPNAVTNEPPKQTLPLPYVAGGVWVPWLDDPNYFEQRGITPIASSYIRSFSTSVELDAQLVNRPQMGLGVGFDISRWHPTSFNPSYSLSMGWAAGDMDQRSIRATASRLSLRGTLCPVELLRKRSIGLRPCARLDAGYVYTHFRQDNNEFKEHSKRYAQLRTTPFVRLSWVPIAGAEVRLDAGVDFELYRPEFRADTIVSGNNLYAGGTKATVLVFQPHRQAPYAAVGLALDW
jgi:hypothetical protein